MDAPLLNLIFILKFLASDLITLFSKNNKDNILIGLKLSKRKFNIIFQYNLEESPQVNSHTI